MTLGWCGGAGASPTSLDCSGLTKNAAGDASAKLCEQSCCAQPTCNIWQWAPGGGNANGCWMGDASCGSTPSKDHNIWVGGARHKPAGGGPSPSPGGGPGADPPEAQPKFDASSWEKIATPHDSVRSVLNQVSASPLSCCNNHRWCALRSCQMAPSALWRTKICAHLGAPADHTYPAERVGTARSSICLATTRARRYGCGSRAYSATRTSS